MNPNGNPNWRKGMPSPNPKGRPTRARETALLLIAHEVVDNQNWRRVVYKRLLDALGLMEGTDKDGRKVLTEDAESTAQGRNASAVWIRDTLIGRPTEFIAGNDDENPYAMFSAYNDDELAQIRGLVQQLQSSGGDGEPNSSGAGTPEIGAAE